MQNMLRVLEFYSGIGGMHYALSESSIPFTVIQSFDINTNANANYLHTFNTKVNPSPPCQPFTRLGLQKDDQDNRTNSFFNLLDILTKMTTPPTYILIENVFGFEKSNTREELISAFTSKNYKYQEFHLSPQSFSIPNQRLRYFCIVYEKQQEKHYEILSNQIPNGYKHSNKLEECKPISEFLDKNLTEEESLLKYGVPEKLLLTKGMLFDIKKKEDFTTNCFTRSYGKLVEGTGSIISLNTDTDLKPIESDPTSLLPLKLRYFSPKEITRLHGFPEEFTFLPSFTPQQCYRLIGNSLNVKIVSELLKFLISDDFK
uniref:DNA (Cytosine-5-)-methyltransferase n=1 Tax=Coremiostelium polycephalum TaxID=142831 RepID=A0A1L2FUP5_9MYCE|nr:DNA (cytosine-5-)-methyltransferase [Coremiostelium polycephalum]